MVGPQFQKRKGFVKLFPVEDDTIGGVVIVWDTNQVKASNLKGLAHRWAISHHDGKLTSPGALSYKTKKQSLTEALKLSQGKASVTLRPLKPQAPEQEEEAKQETGGQKEKADEKPRVHDPPLVESGVVDGKAEIVDEDAEKIQNQEDRDKNLMEAFDQICPSTAIVSAWVEALDASMIIWEAEDVEDGDKVNADGKPKMKTINKPVIVPDHKTRMTAARHLAEFKHGKPIERKEIIERKVFDTTEFDKRLRSPLYLKSLKRKITEAEAKLEQEKKEEDERKANTTGKS